MLIIQTAYSRNMAWVHVDLIIPLLRSRSLSLALSLSLSLSLSLTLYLSGQVDSLSLLSISLGPLRSLSSIFAARSCIRQQHWLSRSRPAMQARALPGLLGHVHRNTIPSTARIIRVNEFRVFSPATAAGSAVNTTTMAVIYHYRRHSIDWRKTRKPDSIGWTGEFLYHFKFSIYQTDWLIFERFCRPIWSTENESETWKYF